MSGSNTAFQSALKAMARADEQLASGDPAAARKGYSAVVTALRPFAGQAPKALSRACLRLGLCARQLGDEAAARECLEESLRVAEAAGLPVHTAEAARLLATLDEHAGALDAAEASLLTALGGYTAAGAVRGTVTVLNALGRLARGRNDFVRALERFEQAERLAASEGFLPGRADALSNLGNLHRVQSDLEGARAAFQGVLSVADDIEDDTLRSRALTDLGNVAAAAGEPEAARTYYMSALELQESRDDLLGAASNRCNLASLWVQQGKLADAVAAYEAALKVIVSQGNARLGIDVTLMLAQAYRGCGEITRSAAVLEPALLQAQALDYAAGELRIEGSLASLALSRGEVVQARQRHTAVVAALRDSPQPSDEVSALLAALTADLAGDALDAAVARLERAEHLVLTRNIVRHSPGLNAATAMLEARRLADGRDLSEAGRVLEEASARLHADGFVVDALALELAAADYQLPRDLDDLLKRGQASGAMGAICEVRSLMALVDAASETAFDALILEASERGMLGLVARIQRRRAECHSPERLTVLAEQAHARGALWEARLCQGLPGQ